MKQSILKISLLVLIVLVSLLLWRPTRLINKISSLSKTEAIYSFSTNQKLVALTIDDGPHPTITPLILDLLEEKQVKATFFLVGNNIAKHQDIAARIVNEGHEIGNHMYHHNLSIFLEDDEFNQQFSDTHELITDLQSESRWLRPGGGLYDQELIDFADRSGYRIAVGNVYPYDATIPEQFSGSAFIENFVTRNVEPGAIIILHDGRIRTVDVLEKILTQLIDEGYEFTTLSKMEG